MANTKQLTIDGFLGVDFASSPQKASNRRAVSGKNWISENGANKKRNGWEQVITELDGKINGVFPFHTSDTYQAELLIFTDRNVYVARKTNNVWTYALATYNATEAYKVQVSSNRLTNLADRRLNASYSGGRIYVPGGAYYCYDTGNGTLYELDAFNDVGMTAALAYKYNYLITVPRTTTNISKNGADATASSVDPVNLLTPYRINELKGDSQGSVYTLDGVADDNSDFYVLVDGAAVSTTNFVLSGDSFTDNTTGGNAGKTITVVFRRDIGLDSTEHIDFNTAFADEQIGDNTVVTTFGIGGYSDRMFLGGNLRRGRVYFSEEDNLGYYPYKFYADVGTSSASVTAFLRLSDESLAIFKEEVANASSVYFMTGRRDYEYNDDGSVKKITPVFSFMAGAMTETAINQFVCGTLLGDSLVTSQNGVFSVALGENVATNTRSLRERSRLINPKLKSLDLSEAFAIVFGGKYYLAVNNEVFIADSDFKWQPSEGEWWQYEWYYWDNVPVRYWFVADNTLMFGTESGKICAFDNADIYSDIEIERYDTSVVTADLTEGGEGAIAYDSAIENKIENGKRLRFLGHFGLELKCKAKRNGENSNREFVVSDDFAALARIGGVVTVDNGGGTSSTFNIQSVNTVAKIVKLLNDPTEDDNMGEGYLSGGVRTYNFTYRLDATGLEFYIVNTLTEDQNFRVSRTKDGVAIPVYEFEDDDEPYAIGVFTETAVVSEWRTPVFDMGTNTHRKTLLRLTISTDNVLDGQMEFGYETRQNISTKTVNGIQHFTFPGLYFGDFTLDTSFASSYTVKARERGFNYIQFYFRSESATNCVVNNLTATYRIIAENRGVR